MNGDEGNSGARVPPPDTASPAEPPAQDKGSGSDASPRETRDPPNTATSPAAPRAASLSLSGPTILTAIALLIFFGWMTYQMFVVRIDGSDAQWARSLAIYTGIESFALAAAGVLLGTQIQAGRVQAAEEKAARKSSEAEQQRKRAEDAEDDLGGHRMIAGLLDETLRRPRDTEAEPVREGTTNEDPRIVQARQLLAMLKR